MSVERRNAARAKNAFLDAVGGALAGLTLGGPVGMAIGIAAGGHFGNSLNPERTG
jgi:hypothetical protein